MGTFRLYFEGLCHFVENQDPNALCKMCVALPDATGFWFLPEHIPMLFLSKGKTEVEGQELDAWLYILRRQRVAFEFFQDGFPLPDDEGLLEFGDEGRRGVVMMEEIAGVFADENLEITAAAPSDDVLAHVILQRGRFKVGADETLWSLPSTLTGGVPKNKRVAERLYLEVTDIDTVRLYIEPFRASSDLLAPPDGETEEIFLDIEPDDDGNIELYLANDCIFAKLLDRQAPAEDFDFRFHYKMLHPASIAAIERLGVSLPFPKRLGPPSPNPEGLSNIAREVLLDLTQMRAAKNELSIIDWAAFIRELVLKLIDILNSSTGCNCLRGGGSARFFDLEDFVPYSEEEVSTSFSKAGAEASTDPEASADPSPAGYNPWRTPSES